jgi:DNA-binding IscR family transcriptional regulator
VDEQLLEVVRDYGVLALMQWHQEQFGRIPIGAWLANVAQVSLSEARRILRDLRKANLVQLVPHELFERYVFISGGK